MRKREVIKIDAREYTIKELTVEEIIELTQGSVFFSDTLKGNEKQKLPDSDEIGRVKGDLKRVMEKCCDFTPDDLVKLAPSEINTLYDKFKEVNSDFLSFLKTMGVTEILGNIKELVLNRFLKTLVTSLRQDT